MLTKGFSMSTTQPRIFVEFVDGKTVPLPAQASAGAAGYDICSSTALVLPPGEYAKVPTGLKLAIPEGFEAQVRPRSGLAAKHGVTVLNAPGTIDSDYRGEVCVLLVNHGKAPLSIEKGMRIAQLVFSRVQIVDFVNVSSLSETDRGQGGFGSTGH
jgi:dUTP pyrophosphatase